MLTTEYKLLWLTYCDVNNWIQVTVIDLLWCYQLNTSYCDWLTVMLTTEYKLLWLTYCGVNNCMQVTVIDLLGC